MKIVVFNGSPKAERGNTHVMVQEFLRGAEEAGAECENVFLAKKRIESCLGCYTCWMKTPGVCVHKDDMPELLSKYIAADILVFATPLYVDNVTGIMKMFMDRLIPVGLPEMEKDEHGETRHLQRYPKSRKMVVISNCGFPDQSQFQVLQLYFRRVARNMHSEVIAELYRAAGGLLTIPDDRLRPFVESYKALVRKAGAEVVKNGKLSSETAGELERPLIPTPNFADAFIEEANRTWARRR